MLTIKIVGTGCPNCRHLEAETRAALASLQPGIAYELLKVTDFVEIADYGILSVPGLVINEMVVCSGPFPNATRLSRGFARRRQQVRKTNETRAQ